MVRVLYYFLLIERGLRNRIGEMETSQVKFLFIFLCLVGIDSILFGFESPITAATRRHLGHSYNNCQLQTYYQNPWNKQDSTEFELIIILRVISVNRRVLTLPNKIRLILINRWIDKRFPMICFRIVLRQEVRNNLLWAPESTYGHEWSKFHVIHLTTAQTVGNVSVISNQ